MAVERVLIRGAEVARRRLDLRIEAGVIKEIRSVLVARPDEAILEANGGALLPGLHDQHLHLNALAAALVSVDCGPPQRKNRDDLEAALRAAPVRNGWIRGTNYFESIAGSLDRGVLDGLRSDVPVRIQHRSGSMWFVNSRGLEALELDRAASARDAPNGVERDHAGRPTGRFFRLDDWLRDRLPKSGRPDLGVLGERLASYGVTALTDTTPSNGPRDLTHLAGAQKAGELPQHVRLMGSLDLDEKGLSSLPTRSLEEPKITVGAHKIILDEPALPSIDSLVARIRSAHAQGRGVAIHAVTRTEIHFALSALSEAQAGARPSLRPADRLEHASVSPPEALSEIERLGLKIVTQPGFVAERGEHYRRNVDPRDLPHLYRVRSWFDRGVAVAGGTDAPFGDPDPWRAMRAAVARLDAGGTCLNPDERVTPEQALDLFCPGTIQEGEVADFCLLKWPWHEARERLSSSGVAATLRAGVVISR